MPHFNIRKRLTPVLLAISLAVTGTHLTAAESSGSGIFKWTDEAGQVHYSQFRPSNQSAEELLATPPPTTSPEAASNKLNEQVKAMDERRVAEKEAKEERTARDEINAQIVKNCETARKNLANLQHGANNAIRTPDGEVKRLTDEERQAMVNDANGQIEKYCDFEPF